MISEKQFDNNFRYVEICNAGVCAKVALQGAHLFHFERKGEKPLLWLSKKSLFEAGKAIRGGVPVCWPWFGRNPVNSDLPQHGFARTSVWELQETEENDKHTSKVKFRLRSSAESLQLWPYKFELYLTITVGQTLTLALTTSNCDTRSFEITAALHSYFAVENIADVHIDGLAGKIYFDKLNRKTQTQQGSLSIVKEVDRVYRKVDYPLILHDKTRTVKLDASGSASAIVWNPWKENCLAMPDMENNAYKKMLCIEAANAPGDSRILAPGEEHTLASIISLDQ